MIDMSDFEEIFKPIVEAWHSNTCYPLAMTYEIDDIVEKAYQAAKQSMQGKREAVGIRYKYVKTGSWQYAKQFEDDGLLSYIKEQYPQFELELLYTHAPDSAARIAEQDAEIATLQRELEEERKFIERAFEAHPNLDLDIASLNIKGGAE